MKGLLPSRADIIVAGVVILDSLMEYFALSEITVSDRDLSEVCSMQMSSHRRKSKGW